MNNFVLEKHRFFPYIAWTLVIGFVVFTYSLTLQLSDTTKTLSQKTEATAAAVENGTESTLD